MKSKFCVLILLVVFVSGFVLAIDEPSVDGAGDVEAVQGVIDDLPFDDSGVVNFSKYKPFRSRAEDRIEAINIWLEENASWLKIVFGMVPSLTLLFAINLYWWMFFFVALVLNGNVFGIGALNKKIDFLIFEGNWGNIFGTVIFVALDALKVFAGLATSTYNIWGAIWNYILPWGFVVAVIIGILAGVVFVFLLIFMPGVLRKIRLSVELRKRKKAREEESVNREALDAIVEGATGQG